MNTAINSADTFFSDVSIDIDALETNIEAFPYSSYARYMLLLHYKKNGHSNFEKVAKKTVLYFNNPYWLQFQLSQVENITSTDSHNNNASTLSHFAVLTEDQIETTNNAQLFSKEENSIQNNVKNEEENSGIIFDDTREKEVYEEKQPAIHTNTFENINEEKNFDADEQTQKPDVGNFYKEEEHQNNPGTSEDLIENKNDISHIQAIKSTEELSHEEHDRRDNPTEEQSNKINLGKILIETTSTIEDTIAFEPLHTVDYFASQGIKIPEEVLMNDKLGTQMKSFTEWLRSMKKLQPGKLPQQNSLAENIIQAGAESSNINTEVLTEAMAEVLIKQGKREKAIEMYTKLSLINPSKSAYFAGKIESIKTT